jgi:hypothetical protein
LGGATTYPGSATGFVDERLDSANLDAHVFLASNVLYRTLRTSKIELDAKTFGYILAVIGCHHSFIALNRELH